MKVVRGFLLAAACCAGFACSSAEEEAKEDIVPAETGSKDRGSLAGGKADCFNCNEEGPGAFQELGLRDSFWKVGDSWQVAYILHADTRAQKEPMKLQQPSKTDAGMVVLNFEVVDAGEFVSTETRPTAVIRITQGEALGTVGNLIDGEIRLDEVTAKIDLEIDDLWRAVAVTEFSGPRGEFPNGQTITADPREAVRSLGGSFPYIVPNAFVGAPEEDLPELPAALAEIAETVRPGYADSKYTHFDLDSGGYEAGEHVFWAKGDIWPFLVRTSSATGVLISQN